MSTRVRVTARAGALLLGVVACAAWSTSAAEYGWPFRLWVAALVLYVTGFSRARHPVAGPPVPMWVGLVAVVIVAAAFRLPGLASIPGSISIDELLPGAEALRIARGEGPNVFASLGWFTMPRLSFVVQGGVLALAGDEPFRALRLASALMGLAGLLATFGLGRRLVGDRAALAGTFLMAVSLWHLHNSRTGFPFWQSSFGTALALYLLIRGRQDGSAAIVALAGVVTGLVLQWYFPVRILLLLTPLLLVIDWFERDDRVAEAVADAGWFILGVLLALGPLLTVVPWGDLTGHSLDVMQAPGRSGWTASLVAEHLGESLRMFSRWTYLAVLHRSPAGLLDAGTRAALVVGIAVALLRGRPAPLFLVGWLGLTLLVGVVLTDSPRASYRLAAAMPAVFLLAGFGADRLLAAAPADGQWYARTVRPAVVAAAMLGVMAHNAYLFFGEYLREDGRETTQAAALREAAARCDGRQVVLALGIQHGAEMEVFCKGAMSVAPADAVVAIAPDRPVTVLLAPDATTLLGDLRSCFAGATVRTIRGRDGEALVMAFDVPFPRGPGVPGCRIRPLWEATP